MEDQLQPAAQPQAVDPEQQKRMLEAKLASAVMWEIVSLMMRSPAHARLTLDDLRWALMPAVANKQYLIVHAQPKDSKLIVPAALVMWASVSPEIDKAMTESAGRPIRLSPEQRRSGNIHWITDAVGDRNSIEAALKRLSETTFAGAPVKMPQRSPAPPPASAEPQA